MIHAQGKNYYTVSEVSKKIGRTVGTISNWYKAQEFAEKNNIPFVPVALPEPRRDFDKLQTRYWTDEQINKLKFFRNSIKRGDLSQYNSQLWGERGKIINEKRALKEQLKKDIEGIDDVF